MVYVGYDISDVSRPGNHDLYRREGNTVKQGYLIDMDGVIYRGSQLISGNTVYKRAERTKGSFSFFDQQQSKNAPRYQHEIDSNGNRCV